MKATQMEVVSTKPTVIETKRLILRPFQLSDLDYLYRIYANPKVMQYVNQGARTFSEVKEELQTYIEHHSKYNFGQFAVIDKAFRRLVGKCGLYISVRSPNVQLAFVLDDSYWNQGLGTEAARASLDFGFNVLGLQRIVAFAQTPNLASQKLLHKLNMQLEEKDVEWNQRKYKRFGLCRAEYLSQADQSPFEQSHSFGFSLKV